MKFLKRVGRWMVTKSNGNQTAGAGVAGVPIVALLSAFGIPIPMEAAAAIPAILSVLTAIGKDDS